jgi:hypothetical protein
MITRGDVVVVDFPFTDVVASNVRPPLLLLSSIDINRDAERVS